MPLLRVARHDCRYSSTFGDGYRISPLDLSESVRKILHRNSVKREIPSFCHHPVLLRMVIVKAMPRPAPLNNSHFPGVSRRSISDRKMSHTHRRDVSLKGFGGRGG